MFFVVVFLSFMLISPIISSLTRDENSKFYLVAFVPVEMKKFNEHGFVWLQVVKFAFNEMMDSFRSEGLFLNVELLILDTRNQVEMTTSHIMDLLFQQISNHSSCCQAKSVSDFIIGFIGPASSSTVEHVLDLLAFDHQFPMISYSATSVRFDNKKKYPTFFRMIPPDNIQAKLILDLMLSHNWTYVGVVAQDDDYGRMGMSELKRLLSTQHICTALEAVVDLNSVSHLRRVVQQMKDDANVNVFVLWIDAVRIRTFFKIAQEMHLYNKTFILCESASALGTILDYDTRVTRGLLSITPSSGVYDTFETQFRRTVYKSDSTLAKRLFEEVLHVNSSIIDQRVTLNDFWDKIPKAKNGFVYNSVRAFGHAMKDFVADHPKLCNPRNTSFCLKAITENRPSFIRNYLKKISFQDLQNKTISFDQNGNINSSQFRISTVQTKKGGGQPYWKRVGRWDTVDGLSMFGAGKFLWSNGFLDTPDSNCGQKCLPGYEHRNGSTECCWTCVLCQDNRVKRGSGAGKCEPCSVGTHTNEDHSKCIVLKKVNFNYSSDFGIALIIVSSFNACTIFIVAIVFVVFKRTPVVLSSQFGFSMAQLFFLETLNILVALSVFKLNSDNCVVYGVTLPFIITMALLPTIFKTQRLHRVFKAKRILTRKHLHAKDICISAMLLFLQSALIVVYSTFNRIGKAVKRIDYTTKEISKNCDFGCFIYFQLAYLFLILFLCGVSAFKARKLPHNYNETRVIAYSMFTNCVILVFIIPLYASSPIESKNRIVIFGLLLIDSNMILFLYMHKVWVIFFHPKSNTPENFAKLRMKHVKDDVSGLYLRQLCHRSGGVTSVESSPYSSRSLMLTMEQMNTVSNNKEKLSIE